MSKVVATGLPVRLLKAAASDARVVGITTTDKANDIVVVTVQGEGVKFYNVHDLRCTASWALSPSLDLALPAVHDAATSRVVVVHDQCSIMSWKDTEASIAGAVRRKLTGNADIVTLSTCGGGALKGHLLVLLATGTLLLINTETLASVEQVDVGLASKDIPLQPSLEVVPADDGGTHILIVGHSPDQGPTMVQRVAITQNRSMQVVGCDRLATPTTSTGAEMTDGLVAWGISRDGRSVATMNAQRLCIAAPLASNTALSGTEPQVCQPTFTNHVGDRAMCSVGEPSTAVKRKRKASKGAAQLEAPVALVPVGASYILMAARAHLGDDVDNVGICLTIWDTKYGTLQADVNLNMASPKHTASGSSGKVHMVRGAGKANPWVAVATETEVVVVPVSLSVPMLIAAAMGRMAATQAFLADGAGNAPVVAGPSLPATFEAVRADGEAEPDLALVAVANGSEEKVLAALVAAAHRKDSAGFQKTLAEHLKEFDTSRDKTGAKSTSKRKKGRALCVLSQRFIERVIDMSLHDKTFFPSESLEALVATECVSATFHKELIPALIERGELGLLELVLTNVHDIPETVLIQIAKHIMATGVKRDTKLFLDLIVSAPRNDIFMTLAVKTLRDEECMKILRYLKDLLSTFAKISDKMFRKQNKKRAPTFGQTLDWLVMMVDGHFATLVLLPECHQLVAQLDEIIELHIQVCEGADQLRALLAHFKRHADLPAHNSSIGVYSIEILQEL